VSTILLTWELGGGFGHLGNLLPVAKRLRERGHRIFAALRDLSRARTFFGDLEVEYLQAPVKTRPPCEPIEPIRTFAHILHDSGFGHADELRTMVGAWRHVLEYVQPDLVLFEHSPTAMLAARTVQVRTAVMGIGFCNPPDVYPLPDLRPWLPTDTEGLRRDENRVLDAANRVLELFGAEPLVQISHLYRDCDANFLLTFKEMDPYPSRGDVEYWGIWPTEGGARPTWPDVPGQRVFAYLKPFPALHELLSSVNRLACPTVAYIDGWPKAHRDRFQSATLRFATERLDLRQVADECDLAIFNGTHHTTVSMLLAGRPILQMPLYLEQIPNGLAVDRLGAGLCAAPDEPGQIAERLNTLLSSRHYAEGAQRFAARYAEFDPREQIDRLIARIQPLLVGSHRSA